MDAFRWILLAIGLLVLAGIYFFTRRRATDERLPLQDDLHTDPLDAHLDLETADDLREPHLDEVDELATSGRKVIYAPELDEAPSSPFRTPPKPEAAAEHRQKKEPAAMAMPREEPVSVVESAPAEESGMMEEEAAPAPQQAEAPPENADLVMLHIVSRDGSGFGGLEIRRQAEALGLRHGDMDIFHALQEGQSLFSLVNAVAPGHFKLSTLAEMKTPAVTLFMQLPVPGDAQLALDRLLDTGYRLAESLGGELLGADKQPLSSEAVDRLRDQVSRSAG